MGEPVASRHKWELPAFAAMLLIATLLRVGWPTLTEFKFSEARIAALALEVTREGHLPLVGVPSSAGFDHSPVSAYFYIPAFLLTASPLPATVYGGLAGVGAVALTWWLARRWPGGGRWAALVATLLFAVAPWAVSSSRKIWQVTFVPLLALAFAGLVVSALVEGRHWRLAWALVVYALLVQTHPSAISLLPALLLWLILFWKEVRLGPLVVGAIAGAVTAIPFLLHQSQSGWPAWNAVQSWPRPAWDLAALYLAWELVTGHGIDSLAGRAHPELDIVPQLSQTFHVVGLLAAAGTVALTWRVIRDWRATKGSPYHLHASARVDLVLLSWLSVPVLFNLRHSLDLYLHFFVLVSPAAYLIVGRTTQALFDRSRSPVVIRVTLAGVGLLAVAQMTALVLMGRFVATHDTSGGFGTPLRDYLAIGDEALALALKTKAAEVLVIGPGDSPVVDEVPAIFDIIFRNRLGYRFANGHTTALFPAHQAVILLAPDAGEAAAWYRPWPVRETKARYRLGPLDGTWPEGKAQTVSGPRLFETGIELQGYTWEGTATPGGQGSLWLLWQVLWRSKVDSHAFVQLIDQEGQVLAQQDSPGYPNEQQIKGDRLLTKFDITIPASASGGPYQAQAGLYLYPEVEPLEVVDGSGEPVGTLVALGLVGDGQPNQGADSP